MDKPMRAKKYLQQLQRLDAVIKQKIKELDELRSMSTCVWGTNYAEERVQTSPSGNAPYEKKIHRMIDLEQEINKEIDDYVGCKHRIINEIQGLSDVNHINLLYKRYVEFKRFEVIAVEMNYTYQYTREIHGYALLEFERTYKNLHKPTLEHDIIVL